MVSMRVCVLGLTALAWLSSRAIAFPNDPPPSAPIKKVSHTMVWEPGSGGVQIPLWPQGAAIQKPESDKPEEIGNGSKLVGGRPWQWVTYVSRPTMTIYRPAARTNHSAIMVLPGGGYEALAMDLKGTEICDWVTKQGMTCILLKYRVPQAWSDADHVEHVPKVQLPLQDAQRAMGLLRQRAATYDIDPHKIGVIGFSAGGHLAAAISNAGDRQHDPIDEADREPSRPDFAILLYPGHLWNETSATTDIKLAPWMHVSRDAPPTPIMQAMSDPVPRSGRPDRRSPAAQPHSPPSLNTAMESSHAPNFHRFFKPSTR